MVPLPEQSDWITPHRSAVNRPFPGFAAVNVILFSSVDGVVIAAFGNGDQAEPDVIKPRGRERSVEAATPTLRRDTNCGHRSMRPSYHQAAFMIKMDFVETGHLPPRFQQANFGADCCPPGSQSPAPPGNRGRSP